MGEKWEWEIKKWESVVGDGVAVAVAVGDEKLWLSSVFCGDYIVNVLKLGDFKFMALFG